MDVKTRSDPGQRRPPLRIPTWLAFCLSLGIAAFFFPGQYPAHILGELPFLLLLLCPVIHLSMHRGHGGHGYGRPDDEDRDKPRPRGTKQIEAQL